MGKRIEVYFDIMSQYSYFAFEGLTRHRPFWKTTIQFKPILLGQVMKKTENQAPIFNPTKEKYVLNDFKLIGDYWGLPVKFPKNFKQLVMSKSTKVPQRILAGLQDDQNLMELVAATLWRRFFQDNREIFTLEDVAEAVNDLPEASYIISLADSEDAKRILIDNTNEAINNECFGAPWTCIRDSNGDVIHSIFGSDRIPQIAFFVGEKFHGNLPEV